MPGFPAPSASLLPPGPGSRPLRPASLLDSLITEADRALRTLSGVYATSARPNPALAAPETVTTPAEKRRIAGLMRINHAGEIAAQALYHGQAFVARDPATRAALLDAAREEGDHLVWCAERIHELGGRTSLLDPLWYGGSFAIGALAASMGDATSFGFVAETEKQVGDHLESHLKQLPAGDDRTRAILSQMRIDEAHHGGAALRAGGTPLPLPVRAAMQFTGKVMTTAARWL
jgi:ubiquinone biosynthesis monooxygenase Coq7